MELESDAIGTDDLMALQAAITTLLQRLYPSLVKDDVAVDLYTDKRRRVSVSRVVVRISIIKRKDSGLDTNIVADSVVTSFEDGSIHDELPSFPQAVRVVVHAQREVLGEWTCWFNSDKPGDDFGDGDVESVEHILAHFETSSLCEGWVGHTSHN